MSKKEITTKIEELETKAFYIQMADRLSAQDWKDLKKIDNEIDALKKMLIA